MKRREFLIDSCTACLAFTGLGGLLSSCSTTHYISGQMNNNGVVINTEEFIIKKNEKTSWRPYVIVRNEGLKFPICVYRLTENEYSALWMQCTHQGAEIQASGNYLQCPAHGSEFDSRGMVTSGPATENLRSFPVIINQHQLIIDLQKK